MGEIKKVVRDLVRSGYSGILGFTCTVLARRAGVTSGWIKVVPSISILPTEPINNNPDGQCSRDLLLIFFLFCWGKVDYINSHYVARKTLRGCGYSARYDISTE